MSVYLYTGYRGYHTRQDKQELLAQWIRCGENIKVMETTLVIQRSQQGELTRGRELLTIAEMQSRGFSKTPANTIYKKHFYLDEGSNIICIRSTNN